MSPIATNFVFGSEVEFSHQQLSGAQLGTLQLELDGRIVLSPTPSNDPNE